MFRAIQLVRVLLLVAGIAMCVRAGVDKHRPNLPVRPSDKTNEDYKHVQRTTLGSFNAKSPRGGTVCTWVGPPTGNWEDASSWSCGHVPTSTSDVEIYTGNVTLNSVADVHSIVVGTGAGLTVFSGKSLNVNH